MESSFSELVLAVSSTSASDASIEHCDDDGIEDGFREFDHAGLHAGIERVAV